MKSNSVILLALILILLVTAATRTYQEFMSKNESERMILVLEFAKKAAAVVAILWVLIYTMATREIPSSTLASNNTTSVSEDTKAFGTDNTRTSMSEDTKAFGTDNTRTSMSEDTIYFGTNNIRTSMSEDTKAFGTDNTRTSMSEDTKAFLTNNTTTSTSEDTITFASNSTTTPTSEDTEVAAATLACEYEVFLSFCGRDTRKGFSSLLYEDLKDADILTFRDDNELRVGKEIGAELLKAVKESKISIPIFSENYGFSKWCLMELKQMVDCHRNKTQIIYPIFIDVAPYDVRNQKGSFEKAFQQHDLEFTEEIIKGWRDALRLVGGLKGLELAKETCGDQSKLVKIVVEKVLLDLKKKHTSEPDNLVGIDKNVLKLKGLLEVNAKGVRIVGIHGMGGLGKTTLAKVTYNQICDRFERHCFLDNVRENSQHQDGIRQLQGLLISKMRNRGTATVVSTVEEGRSKIKDIVYGKKVLLVLDDVDEDIQVHMLMGNHKWFGPQSKIIVTTRDTGVLYAIERTCQIEGLHDIYTSYELEGMSGSDSIQLFSRYAFMRDHPLKGYEHLVLKAVSIAGGLPLVLVVLGSTFFKVECKDTWADMLKKLSEKPHKKVLEVLKFSIDALDDGQKQIFLDIACFFVRKTCEDMERARYMWDDCNFYPLEGISVLIRRSIIKVDNNRFIMHDQLRDLGRQIVREEGNDLGRHSRFWLGKEAMHMLRTCQGTSSVQALCLSHYPYSRLDPLLASCFNEVPNLRYLRMDGQNLDGEFNDVLSSLRWLQWKSSGNFLPTNLQLSNIVVLDLSHSKFSEDWQGWCQFKIGKKLKLLDLQNCEFRILDWSTYTSLEFLDLSYSQTSCMLDGLELLINLRHLDVSSCGDLRKLPSLSNLTNLLVLNVSGCLTLTEINGLESLKSLQVLDITDCCSLKRLPNVSIFKQLTKFGAGGLGNLIAIEGLDKLHLLEHLDIGEDTVIKGVLDMSNLSKLEVLYAENSEIINFSNLQRLKELKISFSESLINYQGVEGLELLQNMEVIRGSVERLPNLSCLNRLQNLTIHTCRELTEIQLFGGLDSLKVLRIGFCKSLTRLLVLSSQRKLKYFSSYSCQKLIEIQLLDEYESLETMEIDEFPSLKRLSLPNRGMLTSVLVRSCNRLIEVKGLGSMQYLVDLKMSYCKKLREIPDLRSMKNLVWLRLIYLVGLTKINGLEELISLKSLNINGCSSIDALPDLSNLKVLYFLDISGCIKLTEVRGLEKLKSLRMLTIHGCEKLGELPYLPNTTIHTEPHSGGYFLDNSTPYDAYNER